MIASVNLACGQLDSAPSVIVASATATTAAAEAEAGAAAEAATAEAAAEAAAQGSEVILRSAWLIRTIAVQCPTECRPTKPSVVLASNYPTLPHLLKFVYDSYNA